MEPRFSFKSSSFVSMIILSIVSFSEAEYVPCEWNEQGEVIEYCDNHMDEFRLVLGLSIGLPIFIITVCVIACCCCAACPLYKRLNRNKSPRIFVQQQEAQVVYPMAGGQVPYPQQAYANYPASNQAPPPMYINPMPLQGYPPPPAYTPTAQPPTAGWVNTT